MLKKVLLTIGLVAVLLGASYRMAMSMQEIESKLNLETASQMTMETMEETEPPTEEVTEAESETEAVVETEPETEEETSSNPYAPSLKLRNSQVVLSVGETLDLVAQVEDVSDDSDDYYYLFRNIMVDGSYDSDTPGEYTLKYTVVDSAGNVSAARYLKVIVKSS